MLTLDPRRRRAFKSIWRDRIACRQRAAKFGERTIRAVEEGDEVDAYIFGCAAASFANRAIALERSNFLPFDQHGKRGAA